MVDALNKQMKMEFDSAYLYLAMSAFFEGKNLKGFAQWLKVQHQEELLHAHKLYNHIFERAATPIVPAIDQPVVNWKTPQEVFEKIYAHEQKVSASIHSIVKLAQELDDFATKDFLIWFVNEQVEEEAQSLEILDYIKMVSESTAAMFQLNTQMFERSAQATPPPNA